MGLKTWRLPKPMCPYCGYIESDYDELEDGEIECGDCEKTFDLTINHTITYTTTKIDEHLKAAMDRVTCPNCQSEELSREPSKDEHGRRAFVCIPCGFKWSQEP